MEIHTGRKPRHGYVWEDWHDIKDIISREIDYEDAKILIPVNTAVRDKEILFLIGCKDPPEAFSTELIEKMKNVFERNDINITTIRVNPQGK